VSTTNGRRRATKRTNTQDPDTKIRKRGNVYYLFHKEHRRISWRLVVALLFVFLGGVGSAVSYAQIFSLQRQIRISSNELTAQQETNRSLDADVAGRYTRDEIERRARELGLSEPDPSQIIYFYAPQQSHVTITYNAHLPQENYFWQGIVAFVNGVIERIFG